MVSTLALPGRRPVPLFRRQRGRSRQELALRASLDHIYGSDVEKGRQNITIGATLRMADALGASLSDLIGKD